MGYPLIWVPSAILTLLLVAVYVIGCLRGRRRFDVAVMVNVAFNATGVVGGTLLIASPFLPSLRANLLSLWVYILIGGLAVLAVSTRNIHRDVFSSRNPNPPGQE